MKTAKPLVPIIISIAILLLIGCGGGSKSGVVSDSSPSGAVSVSLTAAAPTVVSGQTDQLTSTVTGSTNTTVTYAVAPASAGSVSASGLFTAGTVSADTPVVITATSTADSTKSASVTLTATAPVVAITLTASSPTVISGGTDQLAITVTGSTKKTATYTVTPGSAGMVSTAKLFTAAIVYVDTPVTITATADADTTKTSSVTLTIKAAQLGITLTAASLTVPSGGNDQLTAIVTGTPNTNVTYAISPASAGVMLPSGVFSAFPVSSDTPVTITAISVADSTESSSVTLTIKAPIVEISLAAASPSVPSAGTDQLTPTVSGTTNTSVTYAVSPVSAGSVSASGLFSAATVTSDTPVTITATAVADTTKTATVPVTITAYQINSVVYSPVVFCNEYHTCTPPTMKLMGTGFSSTDISNIIPAISPASTVSVVSASEVDLTIRVDQNTVFGSHTFQMCRSANSSVCTPPITFGILTNRNQMAQDSTTGDLFLAGLGGATWGIDHFNAQGTFASKISGTPTAIALDNVTKHLVSTSYGVNGLFVTDESGTFIGAGNNSYSDLALDAKNGFACGAQPSANSVFCADLVHDPSFNSPILIATDADPCSVQITATTATPSETDVMVFSCTKNTLSRYSLPSGALKTVVNVNGITTATSVNTGAQLVALSSAAVGLLSPANQLFMVFNMIAPAGETQRDQLSGYPEGAIADSASGMFIIQNASWIGAVPLDLERMNPATGIISPLNSTFSNVPLGRAISLDDQTFFVGEGSTVVSQPNN